MQKEGGTERDIIQALIERHEMLWSTDDDEPKSSNAFIE
jgi:hypothetical protein